MSAVVRTHVTVATGLLAAALAASCARRMPPTVTTAEITRAQSMWSNASSDELHAGRQVLIQQCSGCHLTPMPAEHTAAQWPKLISGMAERSKLSAQQQQQLERYLVVASSR